MKQILPACRCWFTTLVSINSYLGRYSWYDLYVYAEQLATRHHITAWPFHVPWIQKCTNFNDHISGQSHIYVIGFFLYKNSAPLSLRQRRKWIDKIQTLFENTHTFAATL